MRVQVAGNAVSRTKRYCMHARGQCCSANWRGNTGGNNNGGEGCIVQ